MTACFLVTQWRARRRLQQAQWKEKKRPTSYMKTTTDVVFRAFRLPGFLSVTADVFLFSPSTDSCEKHTRTERCASIADRTRHLTNITISCLNDNPICAYD
ncbi:hypothetical protein ATANTOWER_003495 [Ataeniobius toweri]|uniref:Secreted protein n=1 Tax=Ataeniobius toweri TaxID=208326 RepID=A0ABU7AJC0_9TELE|nr:hypothetical protein [Ataeniobius toweri]